MAEQQDVPMGEAHDPPVAADDTIMQAEPATASAVEASQGDDQPAAAAPVVADSEPAVAPVTVAGTAAPEASLEAAPAPDATQDVIPMEQHAVAAVPPVADVPSTEAPAVAEAPMVDAQAEPVAESAAETPVEPQPVPVAPPNPLLEKVLELWSTVQADSADFTAWTQLVTAAEKLDDAARLRQVFDALLAEYPLCYGYWKKYADAELRHVGTDAATAVFERGVVACSRSVDLWVHYATYTIKHAGPQIDLVRSCFERGIATVGRDYGASPLWDKYIAFESEQPEPVFEDGTVVFGGPAARQADLYCRVLNWPVKELKKFHDGLWTLAGQSQAPKLVHPEEYESIRTAIAAELAQAQVVAAAAAAEAAAAAKVEAAAAAAAAQAAAATAAAVAAADAAAAAAAAPADGAAAGDAAAAAPDGTGAADVAAAADGAMAVDAPAAVAVVHDAAPGVAAGEADGAGTADADLPPGIDAEPVAPAEPFVDDESIKARWLQRREELYQRTVAELALRQPFEDCIKRPYFHVKALDNTQLVTWAKYLSWQEHRGDGDAVVALYERCLVACANYPEFWQRYIQYLETNAASSDAGLAAAADALRRGATIHCKRRSEMQLFAARYNERRGAVAAARALYHNVLTVLSPNLLVATVAAANFERRQGDVVAARAWYDKLLAEEESKASTSKTYAFLSLQYAHWLHHAALDTPAARATVERALAALPSSKALWDGAILLEETAGGDGMAARVLALFDRALKATVPTAAASTSQASNADAAPSLALSEREREELSARAVEFADMHADPAALALAERGHLSRFPLPSTTAAASGAAGAAQADASRKRAGQHDDSSDAKAARTDAAAAASAAPAAHATVPPAPPPVSAAYGAPQAAGYYPPAAAAQYPGYYPGYGAAPQPAYGYSAYPQAYTGYGGY